MNDEHVLRTIELVQAQVRDLEQQLADKKRVVNDLCKLIDRPAFYADAQSSGSVVTSIRSDEFYGKPLATAVRNILEKRMGANLGAATVAEIYEALCEGGMAFEAKNDANAKRGLYVSLSKNPIFHKLPNGRYGLTEWYPNAKPRKETNGADEKSEVATATVDPDDDVDLDIEQADDLVEAAAQARPVKPR